jgi:thiol:disulfide interchange protein
MLACSYLFPVPENTIPTPTKPVPTRKVEPTAVSASTVVAQPNITIVRLHPEDGDLQTMLTVEAEKAIALGQMPTVEFDATWCPPCQVIDQAFESKNELILKAYDGAYIIKLDVDEWGWGDSELHDFAFDGIPAYFKLDAGGNQTGEVIDGNAWGDNIPENIAPPMDEFFHGG